MSSRPLALDLTILGGGMTVRLSTLREGQKASSNDLVPVPTVGVNQVERTALWS